MTIQKTDIKLLESERLTDTPDGGGRMTGVEVVDGQVNNLFNDISRLDRTIGRVSMRKVFVGVQTALNEVYAGAHAIITNPPDDSGVHVTLFSTGDDDDERAQARNRIESYTISGPVSRMRLYDRHISGQRTLQVFQFTTDVLPEIGEVYAISKGENTGSFVQQFFRIVKLTQQIVLFNESNFGTYSVRVINLEIDTALQFDLEGYIPKPREDLIEGQYSKTSVERPMIRQTSIADASRYFGVVPIDQAVTEADLDVMASSIFSAVVPSTQAESPIVDVAAALDAGTFIQSGSQITIFRDTDSATVAAGSRISHFVGSSILPGSLRVESLFNGIQGTVEDDGQGGFVNSGDIFGVQINYITGFIEVERTTLSNGSFNFHFTPATHVTDVSETKQLAITIQNRQLNYTDFLRPIPAPLSLNVSYRSLGKWYRLSDDGGGALIPDVPGTGGGTINYATGSIALTVAFEPDVGSSIIFQWGTRAHYNNRSGDVIPAQPGILLQAVEGHCEPGSVTISWESGGVPKSVTDDGAGNLTGDGVGRILYQTGQVYFVPTAYPDPNVNIQFAYDHGTQIVETFTPSKDGNGFIAMTVGTTPVKPGSVRVSWTTTRTAQVSEQAANLRS